MANLRLPSPHTIISVWPFFAPPYFSCVRCASLCVCVRTFCSFFLLSFFFTLTHMRTPSRAYKHNTRIVRVYHT
ncbi:hypothetical protein BCR43DRAFT_488789 [Syncephalastrum racemosum]|uniref:Uncharacterized protein n=1 Tax=Syncephalastrum racemosum TaxID=13706 RepID=A0A1X2HJ97_SYNRA|nr:hypothetical protein BCR43DRAFT_488789 [Syncephalastrum racemosum]